MRRVAIMNLGLLLCFLVVGTSGTAWACSCPSASAKDHVKQADVVFVGIATAVERSDEQVRATLSLEAVYKGRGAPTVLVDTGLPPGNCFSFVLATRYIVFAKGDLAKGLTADSCSGTTEDLTIIELAGLTPDQMLERYDPQAVTGPLTADGPGVAPPRGAGLAAVIAAGILAIAAAAGTFVAGRRGSTRPTQGQQGG